MDTEKNPSLSGLLEGQPVGTWVVLTPDMTAILSTASTPEEALEKAHISSSPDVAVEERPVMIQVPDPSMICFL